MSFTVKTKIIAGLAVITLIGIITMLFVYRGLKQVESNVHELAQVQEPLILAAYEMEINMNGIGLLVLKYLASRNERYRSWAEKDIADFNGFHTQYRDLVASDEERTLDNKLTEHYNEFVALAKELMPRSDEQEDLFHAVSDAIEEIDHLVQKELQPGIAAVKGLTQSRLNKTAMTASMEAEIAELGFWVVNYQLVQKPEAKEEIYEKAAYFEKALSRFEAQDVTAKESATAQNVRKLFERVNIDIGEVIALEDLINKQRDRFIELRIAMDDMLDDQIQPLARQYLERPRQAAENAARKALYALRTIIPLYVLCAAAIGALLVVFITRPLQRLTQGTEQVGHGDLEYRISERGTDEFNDLAHEFNRMVSRLQATTVTRDLLEESENKLRDTVAQLRHEIGERERSEDERFKLSEALRRKEHMAAMGSLVAGVAHEVRNPLFGISSSLDAMEARLSGHDELKCYFEVLRKQTQRLSALMENLLHYGKPFVSEFKPLPVVRVIREAIEGCSAIAQHCQVRIAFDEPSRAAAVMMDENRLPLIFQNLLENAIQHTLPGGAVRVELAEEENLGSKWVVIKVSDSGPGFSEKDVAQVFAPFFTRRKAGTGLGLSIAQRIVEHHGGNISASNLAGGGAVMTVRLPPADSLAAERKIEGDSNGERHVTRTHA